MNESNERKTPLFGSFQNKVLEVPAPIPNEREENDSVADHKPVGPIQMAVLSMDARKANALKTLIANDPGVQRLLAENGEFRASQSYDQTLFAMLRGELETVKRDLATAKARLFVAETQLNSFGALIKAFFRKLLGRTNTWLPA